MKKTIKIILIVIAVVVVILIAVPFLFKDKILTKVKAEINNSINAKVDFKDYGLSIFQNFPNLTLSLGNLSVVGINEFEGDTLAGIGSLGFTLDIMSVISGSQIKIIDVDLKNANLQFLVLKDGKANWDIAKASADSTATTSEPSQFKIGLKRYAVTDSRIFYSDQSVGMDMLMENVNINGKGDFTQDIFNLETKLLADALTVNYAGVEYISKAKTDINAELIMDMVNSKYTFKENEIKLNELALGLDGFIAMPTDDINMDLKFNVKQNEFKAFMSMIPGLYREGFDKVQSAGKLSFNGFVKGTYNETTMPGFELTLNIANGMLKYPDLPTAINNVQVDLYVSNPDGVPDNTVINLKKLHAEMGAEPFDARLYVKTPVSDADIDASIKGRVDLANISKIVPLEQGTTMKGVLNANITARGKISSIENREYENFNASGSVLVNDLNYVSNDFKQGVFIQIGELIFNPKNITLNQLDLKSGKTDIKASGWLDNLLTYMFKENELLKGTLNIKSNVIDLNEFMGPEETTAASDSVPTEIFEVPANMDFLITADVGKVFYEDLILEAVNGNIAIRDQSMGINDLKFNMLEGSIAMDGLYETKNPKSPNFFMDLNLSQLDINQTYDKFIAVQKMAPIAKQCKGKYSASFDVKGNLDQKMEPVITTFTGGGKLSTSNVTVTNFNPLVKLAETIKMEQFKKMDLKNLNLSFSFSDGRVNIDPFDINVQGINTTIQGSNGFDQSIDYSMDLKIPTQMMGSSASGVVSGLFAKANSAAGTNLSMGKEVKLTAKLKGTIMDPKIETSLKDIAGGAVADVKEQLKNELDAKKKELEDKARSEADRMKQEAEDKARSEADRMKKEAEAKAKAESDRLKKEAENKLKKEAEDKLKNIFGKPK